MEQKISHLSKISTICGPKMEKWFFISTDSIPRIGGAFFITLPHTVFVPLKRLKTVLFKKKIMKNFRDHEQYVIYSQLTNYTATLI